jgi:predicted unusual protein kinase regulating ubiquinone biosynthesis (AarF/ABC1/UbiB family)
MNNRVIRTLYAVLQIFLVLLSYLWYRWVTYYLVGRGGREAAFERVHERGARRLFHTFARLRGAYIKLGQFLSTQAFLPPAYLLEFAKMQDQVRPVSFAKVATALAHEWGPGWRDKIESIEEKPLAAASIAQVHKARLKDGRDVVIKVQYPGIDSFFHADLALVAVMLPLYIKFVQAAFSDLRTTIDYQAHIAELFDYIGRELDYGNEIKYQKKMAANFAGWKTVKVPALVEELCTRRTICMEFVQGKSIMEWFSNSADDDRADVFETFTDVLLYSVIVKGLFQSDNHPGNFLVTPDKKIVLLDFGCIKEFKPAFRRSTIKVAQGYINRDARAVAEVLSKLGFATQDGKVESFQKWVEYGFAVADMVVSHWSTGGDLAAHLKEHLAGLAMQAKDLNRDYPMASAPEEYMLLGRMMATPAVPLDKYSPKIDIMGLVLEHLASADVADDLAAESAAQ